MQSPFIPALSTLCELEGTGPEGGPAAAEDKLETVLSLRKGFEWHRPNLSYSPSLGASAFLHPINANMRL